MDIGIRAVVTVIVGVLPGVGFGQVKSDEPIKLLPCADSPKNGRRIVSNLEIVEFYLPRFATVKKTADVDYVEYYVRYRPKHNKVWLKFMMLVA